MSRTADTLANRTRRPFDPLKPRSGARIVQYVLLLIVIAVFGIPLYWLISSSIKPPEEVQRYPAQWIPHQLHWQNFADALTSAPFARYALNSAITVTVGTLAELTIATLCAFAFAFLRFPLKKLWFAILLGALMVPGHIVLLPNYLTVAALGWTNTYAGLIVPGLGSVFVTFLLRQQMLGMPRELLEAAQLDGAGQLRILFSVVLPLVRPMLTTGAIVTAINKWNEYVWPLVVTNTESMRTLPVGLVFARTSEGGVNWGVVMAATLLVAAPMLIVYFAAQRFIVSGITEGALKS